MEYRKLISFGKNSFVLTLPKAWVRSNKLQKGDLVYIKENINNLILYPQQQGDQESKEIIIDVNKKSIRHIQREIIAAYIRNYRRIVLVGEEIIDKKFHGTLMVSKGADPLLKGNIIYTN